MGSALRYRDPLDPANYAKWAKWIRELARRSGAYVIRAADTKEVLYVGESHTGRLYSTLTRHFQDWTGYTAGTTYDRFGTEVAVTSLDEPAALVVQRQVELIKELSPRDNQHHMGDDGEDDEFDPDEFRDDWW